MIAAFSGHEETMNQRPADRAVFLEEAAQASFESARIAVLPVPYEATVSYGRGTAEGPRAILEASTELELYDELLNGLDLNGNKIVEPTQGEGGVSLVVEHTGYLANIEVHRAEIQ